MRMSEVFELPIDCSIDEFPDGRDGIYFAEDSSITEYQAVATDIAINSHDQLTDENARLREENAKLKGMIDNGLGWEDMKGGNRSDVE